MGMVGDSGFVGAMEVVGTGRRRRWSETKKVRIVEVSLAESRPASATARRYDIANSSLFKMRKAYQGGRRGGTVAGASPLMSAVLVADAVAPPPASLPSDYWKRRCKATFQFDTIGMKLIEDRGVETLMWGLDDPHGDGVWPESPRYIKEQFGNLPASARRKIICANAGKFYGLIK
jgi:transposase-like protein